MVKIAKSRIDKKNEEIKHLDVATQAIILRLNKSDKRLKISAFVLVIILLATGVVGIFYQNHYALKSTQHIDCIIKDLSTPVKPGTTKHIDYQSVLNKDCKIKFNS